jgi:hypothetical protein
MPVGGADGSCGCLHATVVFQIKLEWGAQAGGAGVINSVMGNHDKSIILLR